MQKLSCITLYVLLAILSNHPAIANETEKTYFKDITKTNEEVSDKTAEYVYKKIMQRDLEKQYLKRDESTQFGLHGMEMPAINVNGDRETIDRVYSLLARAGVDSLRSAETCWHRVSNVSGAPVNFEQLDFQLKQAKQYHMSHLFIFGYPPAKYTVGNNKLSAVQGAYIKDYNNYLDVVLSRIKEYDVPYIELGNEVDAPNVWWIKSTSKQYVEEMKLLKEAIIRNNLKSKTVAFSATYSRNDTLGGASGGRQFLDASFKLGIDKFSDAYSMHHFVYGKDDIAGFIRHEQDKFKLKNKDILNTEQLDTSPEKNNYSKPYDLVKLFSRTFFYYGIKRMDYFIAQDRYLNNKLYYIGLFDVKWRPKLRLLAYAMASDAMKGKMLVGRYSPKKDVEAYVLKSKEQSNNGYTIVVWKNKDEYGQYSSEKLMGLQGNVTIERWNLDVEQHVNSDNGILIDDKPIAIYTTELPNWDNTMKFNYHGVVDDVKARTSEAPMP